MAGKTRAETFLSGSNLVFVPRAAAALYETHGTANRTEIIGKPLSMMRQHSPASLGVVTRRLGRFGSYPPWVQKPLFAELARHAPQPLFLLPI